MQKAKKMRKQTLVIAVLAILLVLSLALSVTGAWFTDKDTASATSDIQFATVAVNASDMTATVTSGTRTQDKILPGDSISLAGSIDNSTSTVDIYLAVKVSAVTVKGADETEGTKSYDIDLSSLETYITIGAITFASPLPTGVTDVTADTDATGYTLYKVAVQSATTTLNYTGSVEFETSLPNEVVIGSTTYVLNDRGDHNTEGATVITGVQIAANLEVVAVQADNMAGDTDADKAQAAADILETLFTPAA